ncbi:MAG: hypothetical protein GW778_07785 [Alphaproteobacteria bacterium]|nr:hypothetical protein [Alphaproteobacteria bacterium]
MGFKRTPEGRVFFQGTDTANDESGPKLGQKQGQQNAPQQRASNPSPQMRSPLTGEKTQGQIVTLLKTLNERLKVTQADRDRMMVELEKHRNIIEDLEDKASRSEKLALDLEHKLETQSKKAKDDNNQVAIKELEETRRALAEMERNQSAHNKAIVDKITKSSSGIKALHKRIESTEAKQGVIDERVEAALTEQAKIIRKVDKAIEDRARFMRKIERIEETVIQTRDALNAKAMVVLTEQGVHANQTPLADSINEGIAKYLPDDLESQIEEAARNAQRVADIKTPARNTAGNKDENTDKAIWQNPTFYGALTGALAFILAIVVIGGLALNDWKLPSQGADNDAQEAAQAETYYQTPQAPIIPQSAQPIEDITWSIEEQPSQASQASNESAAEESAVSNAPDITAIETEDDDIGTVNINDTEQVARLIETAPQKVAEALNQIEPQKQAPQPAIETPAPAAPEQKVEAIAPAQESYASQQPNAAQANVLSAQASRDPNLPNAIKKVEDQAFEGIGEAQHDLAAIYTAGHGGVKQDYSRAAFWFEKAAENGVANASYNLGVLHHQGLGFEPDVRAAMAWYKDAANKGHPEAQYNLGIAYIEGIGVPYDPVLASNYFEKAALNGVVEAAYNLGLIYENGLLGAAEPDSALRWYKAAADQGSPEAKQALNDLAGNLGINANEVNRIADEVSASQPANTQSSVMAATSNLGLVAQIQEYLMRAGLYPGPADGVSGALTSDAIRAYQSNHDMNVDGEVSQNLLSHMLSNAN